MKKFKYLLIVFLFFSCSYKVTRYDYKPIKKVVNEPTEVIIKKNKILVGLPSTKIGTIKLDEKGFTKGCNEAAAMEILKREAISVGANFVNIVEEAEPDGYSTCYRCIADLYKIESIDEKTDFARDTLIYNENRPLTWADFSAKPDINDTTQHSAHLSTTIQMVQVKVNMWFGHATFDVYGVVFKDASWVKAGNANDINLLHNQVHFEISALIAIMLEKDINKRKINAGSKGKIDEIFYEYDRKLADYQALYDKDTDFGLDAAKQKLWKDKVIKKLGELK